MPVMCCVPLLLVWPPVWNSLAHGTRAKALSTTVATAVRVGCRQFLQRERKVQRRHQLLGLVEGPCAAALATTLATTLATSLAAALATAFTAFTTSVGLCIDICRGYTDLDMCRGYTDCTLAAKQVFYDDWWPLGARLKTGCHSDREGFDT